MKASYPADLIETPRLILKKRSVDQATELFSLIDVNRSHLGDWLPWEKTTKSVQDTVNYIKFVLSKWEEREIFDYSIFLKTEDKTIGSVGSHHLQWDQKICEYGYWVGNRYTGQGYVAEALKALEDQMSFLGFKIFVINCDKKNVASSAVAIRANYKLFQEILNHETEKGVIRDTLVYIKNLE